MDDVCDVCGHSENDEIHEDVTISGGHMFESSLRDEFFQHIMRDIWDNSREH